MAERECKRCGKLSICESVPTGEKLWLAVDARRRTAGGARVGWAGSESKRVGLPVTEPICHRCLGKSDPRDAVAPPVWKQAKSAWAAAVAENPALARFAPRSR